jgi:hypothetical protein
VRVLAVDPGKMTGLAEWSDYGGYEPDEVPHLFRAWALPYADAMSVVTHRIMHHEDDAVTMEDFVISERTAKMSTAGWRRGSELEFIGVVRWHCEHNDVGFNLYTPAQAKSFSTDAKLKRMDWWTKGLDHPRDAARHLLLYLVENRLIDPRELVG